MLNIRSIALAAALAVDSRVAVDAAGCYATYSGGGSYSAGDWVSATKTTTETETKSCTIDTAGCTTGYKTTTTTTSVTNNYQCTEYEAWCSSSAYDPAGIHSGSAWTKEDTQCTGSATPATAPVPAKWKGGGCPKPYVTGTDYDEADYVTVVKSAYSMVYACGAAPNNLWCGMEGYEPGTSTYWKQAWTEMGSCTGTISPTSSPIYVSIAGAGGCPGAFEGGADYEAGDEVAKDGLVYQCKPFPYSGHCSQTGYEPATSIGSGAQTVEFWKEAWTVTGWCDGTITPTSSPSFDQLESVGGCPEEWTTKTYEEGDRVSSTVFVYECKSYPQSGHCGQAGYQPGGTTTHPDAWKAAWTIVGVCNGSIGPTSSPSFDPLSSVGACADDWMSGAYKYEEGDMVSVSVSKLGKVDGVVEGKVEGDVAGCVLGLLLGPIEGEAPGNMLGKIEGCLLGDVKGEVDDCVIGHLQGLIEGKVLGNMLGKFEGCLLGDVGVRVRIPIRKVTYKCRAWPYSAYCGQYSPTQYGGNQGWSFVGGCDGSIGPTSSPSFDKLSTDNKCPQEWSSSTTDYEAGDLVSKTVSTSPSRKIRYKCRDWPNSGYCNQGSGFEPGTTYGNMAWTLMGACEGTFAPSSSPVQYAGSCKYDQCRMITVKADCNSGSTGCSCTGGSCTGGDAYCSCAQGEISNCKLCEKDVKENQCIPTDVDPWDTSFDYYGGDVVRVGTTRFKCREGAAFFFWCRVLAYKPELESNSIWNQAWRADGVCV